MSPYCGSGPFLDMVDGAKKKDIKIPVLKKKKKKKIPALVELTSWGGM